MAQHHFFPPRHSFCELKCSKCILTLSTSAATAVCCCYCCCCRCYCEFHHRPEVGFLQRRDKNFTRISAWKIRGVSTTQSSEFNMSASFNDAEWKLFIPDRFFFGGGGGIIKNYCAALANNTETTTTTILLFRFLEMKGCQLESGIKFQLKGINDKRTDWDPVNSGLGCYLPSLSHKAGITARRTPDWTVSCKIHVKFVELFS